MRADDVPSLRQRTRGASLAALGQNQPGNRHHPRLCDPHGGNPRAQPLPQARGAQPRRAGPQPQGLTTHEAFA
jgi:hypothetical protein